MSEITFAPMSAEDAKARKKLLARLVAGSKLTIIQGIKKGRTAIYVREDPDNPWLLNVLIDRVPRVVRFDWVLISSAP